MEKIDLHIHTNYSDGQLNVFDILEIAKKEGIQALAITDHDTIINLKGVKEIAKLFDIDMIEGIEISVGQPYNIHMLGYGILDFDTVESYIKEVKYENMEICKRVIKLLQEKGYDITEEEIYEDMEKRRAENLINCRLIQKKCKEKGIDINDKLLGVNEEILDKRSIAKLLVKKGYAKNNKDVYDSIMGRDCDCYIPIKKITAKEAIELITKAGGVPVLAHPGTIAVKDESELEELIIELKKLGLRGLEIVNVGEFEEELSVDLARIADENDLIQTVGTDFHRPTDINSILGLTIQGNKSIIEGLKGEIERANEKYKIANNIDLGDR